MRKRSFFTYTYVLRTLRGRAASSHARQVQAVNDLGRQGAAPLIERAYAPTVTLCAFADLGAGRERRQYGAAGNCIADRHRKLRRSQVDPAVHDNTHNDAGHDTSTTIRDD